MKPLPRILTLLAVLACQILAYGEAPSTPTPGATARLLPIAGDAFAGSSVNVVSGLQNTLFTDRGVQFAAFYAADATLVLAKRPLGSDTWETRRTPYSANVNDAHRTVAIVVDGEGCLHVAWDHHNNTLNYARGTAPGSLDLGPRESMTGKLEGSVTYPLFLRLPDGDLLFIYRDGGSGRGNLVLNRYSCAARSWTQVHGNLIDGEGQRNAYASFALDARGVLHAAWVWRETPDVATNHDLCYARSADGGVTWTTSTGAPLALPISAANAEYALRIPQNSSLMNPPAIGVDGSGRPLVANYWAPPGTDVPQYHLVRRDEQGWHAIQVTQRTTPFSLAGGGTKRPPLSRSVILANKGWRKPQEVFLVYRDDERGGRIVVASCRDLDAAQPAWTFADLTADSVGAWEPSLDPVQAQRLHQLHMLVQRVEQRDGNDRQAAAVEPATISSLIWSPFTAAMVADPAAHSPAAVPAAGALDRPLDAAAIVALLYGTADWQLARTYPAQRDSRGWEIAPFYLGVLALADLPDGAKYDDAMLARCEAMKWEPAPRMYHADDHCVIQAYGILSRRHHDARMLAPSKARLDAILANPATTPLDWDLPGATDRWSWCDALFMGPASWLIVAEATGDPRYVEFANREWWATVDKLYRPEDRFFARDESFLDLREPNGRRLFWSRGNGWVAAGLCHVLELFPENHPDHARYVALYHDMMDAVLAAQQPDGLWRPGLLAPDTHTARETSGSSFYTFALAWGVNHGLLDRTTVTPAIRRAWNALAACVTPEGKLEHVQPIGAAPEGFDPHHNDWFGVGAFLLAGAEVYEAATRP